MCKDWRGQNTRAITSTHHVLCHSLDTNMRHILALTLCSYLYNQIVAPALTKTWLQPLMGLRKRIRARLELGKEFCRKKHGISTPYISRLESCMCEGIHIEYQFTQDWFLSRRNTCFFLVSWLIFKVWIKSQSCHTYKFISESNMTQCYL